jgi:hypothetical protein
MQCAGAQLDVLDALDALDALDVRSYTVSPPMVFAVKWEATQSAIAELELVRPPPPPDDPAM